MNNETNRSKPQNLLSDESIIELYWKRNEKAIEATDDKYGKYLFTIAYNIVHDKLDCEECLNDTYLGTWNTIPPNRPNAFQAFLTKIMRNIAVGRYRKNMASKRVPSELTLSLAELDDCIMVSSPSAEEEFTIKEIGRILSEFLRELSDRSEFIFVCRYYYADPIKHIAQMLRMSESTVYRELSELRSALRERLEKEGYYHA